MDGWTNLKEGKEPRRTSKSGRLDGRSKEGWMDEKEKEGWNKEGMYGRMDGLKQKTVDR